MSKFDETREGFIEWQAARIKELESQLAKCDELEDRVNSLQATLEELKQKLEWLENRVYAIPLTY